MGCTRVGSGRSGDEVRQDGELSKATNGCQLLTVLSYAQEGEQRGPHLVARQLRRFLSLKPVKEYYGGRQELLVTRHLILASLDELGECEAGAGCFRTGDSRAGGQLLCKGNVSKPSKVNSESERKEKDYSPFEWTRGIPVE